MKKNRFFLMFAMLMLVVGMSSCSNDDNEIETVDYYGTSIPYTPIEEKDLPEWLRELKNEKRMFALWRICVGTLNDETIWHLNVWTDSSYCGYFYDKDGTFIPIKGDDLINQIRNVRCIYYRTSWETSEKWAHWGQELVCPVNEYIRINRKIVLKMKEGKSTTNGENIRFRPKDLEISRIVPIFAGIKL